MVASTTSSLLVKEFTTDNAKVVYTRSHVFMLACTRDIVCMYLWMRACRLRRGGEGGRGGGKGILEFDGSRDRKAFSEYKASEGRVSKVFKIRAN